MTESKPHISLGFIISAGVFTLITGFKILFDKKKLNRAKELFSNKFFLINMVVIAIFSFYALNLEEKDEKVDNLQLSIKHGLLGLIIAVLANIDLVVTPFWLIFLASYYLGMG
jgi:hypothetical protein|tara:strand:+ start:163 stop:501 length:339 start_codon:yes stop_codon:yes gene_type:complete